MCKGQAIQRSFWGRFKFHYQVYPLSFQSPPVFCFSSAGNICIGLSNGRQNLVFFFSFFFLIKLCCTFKLSDTVFCIKIVDITVQHCPKPFFFSFFPSTFFFFFFSFPVFFFFFHLLSSRFSIAGGST